MWKSPGLGEPSRTNSYYFLLQGVLCGFDQRTKCKFLKQKTYSSYIQTFSSSHFQREFIQFCKTLYSMFHKDPEENDLYQAIATVTTLLLQIGEVGQRGSSSGSGSQEGGEELQASAPSPSSEQDLVFADTDTGQSPQESQAFPEEAQGDWTVSLEHILASLLTEQSLVNFFEKPLDIKSKLENAKLNQYSLKTCEMSRPSQPELKLSSP